MTRDQIIRAQRAVNDAGLGPIAVDGIYGPITANAYFELLRRSGLAGAKLPLPAPPAPKPWWASRAIWGALATIVASLAGAIWSIDIDAAQLTDTLLALVTASTGLLALWGSVRRTAPIDPTLVAPGVRMPVRERVCGEPLPPDAHPSDPARADFWRRDRGPLGPS